MKRSELAAAVGRVIRTTSSEEKDALSALARGERASIHIPWGRARDTELLGRLVVTPGVGFRDGALGMELFIEEDPT